MKTYAQNGNNALLILNQKTSKKVFVKTVVINYTIFHLECGKQQLVAHSIKFFETFLETHGFLRVHRSFMINPNHVNYLNKAEYKVIMNNGIEAIISRRRINMFKCLS
jgi:DNA-binding LytR/AlgR family response regulator